ncbi:MAG: SufD family Fe-S cluster assembly protein, partial [Pseudomonadota bacterium]
PAPIALPPVLEDWPGPRAVFVDGVFDRDLSRRLEATRVKTLRLAMADDPALVESTLKALPQSKGWIGELNAGLFTDGLIIDSAEAALEGRLLVVHVSTGAEDGGHTLSLVRVRAGDTLAVATANVALGDAKTLSTHGARVLVDEGGHFDELILSDGHLDTALLQRTDMTLQARASGRVFSLMRDPSLTRIEMAGRFEGEEATLTLGGITLLDGADHGDITTHVHHAAPDCSCEEDFRTVLLGSSRGVFQGKIHVDPIAQKTDSQMGAKGLVLSERAEMDLKPELEIYADDVKCSHGATIGALDEDAIFYLRARGIGRKAAERLLVGGFVEEAIDAVAEDETQGLLRALAQDWLTDHF